MDDALKDFIKRGCNERIANLYLKSDIKIGEIILRATESNIPYNQVVASIGILYNLTPEHAKIVVDNRINDSE